jgi:hypothetical protein
LDPKSDPKKNELRKKEAETLEQELQVELARLREERLRAQKFSKPTYLLLVAALAIPFLFTRELLYWVLSIALWVVWFLMKRARKDAFKK